MFQDTALRYTSIKTKGRLNIMGVLLFERRLELLDGPRSDFTNKASCIFMCAFLDLECV